LYDFECRSCGRVFETLVRTGTTPACPQCGATDLERQLSSFAVNTPERSRASAKVKREKAAAVARTENVVREREIEKHRHEDH
jgi:putative FmdB family regulatory protein